MSKYEASKINGEVATALGKKHKKYGYQTENIGHT